jgi:RNA-directed DNA polymerase
MRAWSLYGELCRRDVLNEALAHVIHNDGAAGIDGLSARALCENEELGNRLLDQPQGELRERRHRPSPLKRVHIRKEDGKWRALGIPTVKDRTVQTAALIVLLPIFEADMHEHSYAYRPGRNARQAVDAIKQALLSGRTEVLDADLSAYS